MDYATLIAALDQINNIAILILAVVGIVYELLYVRQKGMTPQSKLKLFAIVGLGYVIVLQIAFLLHIALPSEWHEWGIFLLVCVIVAKAISESTRGNP